MINNRWEWLVSEVEFALNLIRVDECTEVTEEDIKQVISVLKNNVPFGDEEND